MVRCRTFGHRHRFEADGATMRWACERCGLPGGEKTYPTAEDAARYARAFNREDRSSTGKHPTLSTLPLWVAHKLRGDRDAHR